MERLNLRGNTGDTGPHTQPAHNHRIHGPPRKRHPKLLDRHVRHALEAPQPPDWYQPNIARLNSVLARGQRMT
jgi:hypothetical protein